MNTTFNVDGKVYTSLVSDFPDGEFTHWYHAVTNKVWNRGWGLPTSIQFDCVTRVAEIESLDTTETPETNAALRVIVVTTESSVWTLNQSTMMCYRTPRQPANNDFGAVSYDELGAPFKVTDYDLSGNCLIVRLENGQVARSGPFIATRLF